MRGGCGRSDGVTTRRRTHPTTCEGREKEQYNGAEGGAEMRGERKEVKDQRRRRNLACGGIELVEVERLERIAI
jgi:hypothetical protein